MKTQECTNRDHADPACSDTPALFSQPAAGGARVAPGLSGHDLALGVLSVTAVILLVAVFTVQALRPEPALAFAQNGRAGKYVVATSQLDDTAELLLVFNTEVGQMNVYGFNVQANQLELIQQLDIDQLTRRVLELRERLSAGRRP